MLRRIGLIVWLLVFCVAFGVAQNTTLSGTLNIPGGATFSGTMILTLTQPATALSTCSGGPTYVVPSSSTITISAGSMVGTNKVWGADCTTPSAPYNVIIKDQQNNILVRDQWLIAGSTFNIGLATSALYGSISQSALSPIQIYSTVSGHKVTMQTDSSMTADWTLNMDSAATMVSGLGLVAYPGVSPDGSSGLSITGSVAAQSVTAGISLVAPIINGAITYNNIAYSIGSTRTLTSQAAIKGTFGGTTIGSNHPSQGTRFNWTGASSIPMFTLHDATNTTMDGFSIDCQPTSSSGNTNGVDGIDVTSDNSPISTFNSFEHFTVSNCANGMYFGSTQNPDGSGTQYQNDHWLIRNTQFNINSIGLNLFSQNTGQASEVDGAAFYANNVGFWSHRSGSTVIRNSDFGVQEPGAYTPSFIRLGLSGYTLIDSVQGESCSTSPKGYMVDYDTSGSGPVTILNSVFNCPSLYEDYRPTLSMGNTFNGNYPLNATFYRGSSITTAMISIGDTWGPESSFFKMNAAETLEQIGYNHIAGDGTIGLSLPEPQIVSATAVAGGSLTSGTTYYYRVTALDAWGSESDSAGEVSATPSGGNLSVSVAFPVGSLGFEATASSYRLYRGTASGVQNGYISCSTSPCVDSGGALTSAYPPSVNGAYLAKMDSAGLELSTTVPLILHGSTNYWLRAGNGPSSYGYADYFTIGQGTSTHIADFVGGSWYFANSQFQGTLNAVNGYKYNGTSGYSGTKTAGSCVLTIQGGIITNVTGC